MILSISCGHTSHLKKTESIAKDTFVDFSRVDVSPAFKECQELLENTDKTNCFRANMRYRFTKALKAIKIGSDNEVDETITVILVINNKGKMTVTDILSSKKFKRNIPEFSRILDSIVSETPKLFPATKRGIPVNTEYKLPIKIKTLEKSIP